MKFQIEINCDNAAFEDGPANEVARILEDISGLMRSAPNTAQRDIGHPRKLRDINGNTIGFWKFMK